MPKILGQINEETRKRTAKHCKDRNIIIPTFAQLRDPDTIPIAIKNSLASVNLQEINPLNLFRINWKNDISTGLFGSVNYLEIPSTLSGVKARIIGLCGKFFPTGSHKVGAAFDCLVPRLITGEFDPLKHKAVWPSTGNYCRGGAFDCALLDCEAVAVMPEQVSEERFSWLKNIGATIISTPGGEANVKEIYDKCKDLEKDPSYFILNQFSELGNALFNYQITGPALYDAFNIAANEKESRIAGFVAGTGSAGSIASADYLKKMFPLLRTTAAEALECPTILCNGFGSHRIEGIGNKQIPWIFNVRNTDSVAAIREEDCLRLLRTFNEIEGKGVLIKNGVEESVAENLSLLGISSICNLLAAIKLAKYFEFSEQDVIFTLFTDSSEMYISRLGQLNRKWGEYSAEQAQIDLEVCLKNQSYDNFLELSYRDKKRIHNLKYFTWVEQQNKSEDELKAQWSKEYWEELFENQIDQIDTAINEFNELVKNS